MEVDLRSTSPVELRRIDEQFKAIINEAVAEENAVRSTANGRITAELVLAGERPTGVTPPDTPELRQVAGTMQALNKVPAWGTSSTDANIPISLGIPAFPIAPQAAHRIGPIHSLAEWTDVEKFGAVEDFRLALALILSVADLP